MQIKQYTEQNVYDAAKERLRYIFSQFNDKVIFSFSAGKDSSVMIHLAKEVAGEMNCLPLKVLFIDLEAQYKLTIDHAEEIMTADWVDPYWICLPLHLRNAVSCFEPQWVCWNPDEKERWVRELPEHKGVISNPDDLPFFRYGMEFEEFVVDFAQWLAKGEEWAVGVGIRSNESFNRYRTLFDSRKQPYKEKPWTTLVVDNVFNFYPIYDWTTEDIWTAVGKFDYSYNHIYDLMYQQGKSIHECRICQPYGDDQRKGLDLFRTCEPETWAKVVDRVAGSNFGNIYCRSYLLGHMKVVLPEGHTWKTYTEFLLATIPKCEAEWYMTKFRVFIKWWEDKGYPADEWPDAKLKKGDDRLIGPDGRRYTKGPAWERLAKCILKNDKLCKSLSFAATKGQYSKYQRMKEEYGY